MNLPTVTCADCGRSAACVRVSDGTLYRPTTWVYPYSLRPYEGVCQACRLDSAQMVNHAIATGVKLLAKDPPLPVDDSILVDGTGLPVAVRVTGLLRDAFNMHAGLFDIVLPPERVSRVALVGALGLSK